jgi:methylated-DNA-[protein]-cysteine S-methyltransferase
MSTPPGTDPLRDALPPALYDLDPDALSRLRRSLLERADTDGLLDIAYRTLDTPVGTLLLAATGTGVVRIAFEREDHDRVLVTLADRVSPRILLAPGRLDPVARQVSEYFNGARTSFDVPVDLRLSRGFRRDVLQHLRAIGYGSTESYAQVAAATGHPRAVRAVGTACATNPLPVVVPCHRVVRSDGSTGSYVGGSDAKAALLQLESTHGGAVASTRTVR